MSFVHNPYQKQHDAGRARSNPIITPSDADRIARNNANRNENTPTNTSGAEGADAYENSIREQARAYNNAAKYMGGKGKTRRHKKLNAKTRRTKKTRARRNKK